MSISKTNSCLKYLIFLQFSDFSTIAGYDEVLIFVGGKTEDNSQYVDRLSGQLTKPYPQYQSKNNYMLVKFYSTKLNNGKGFSASWTAGKVYN